MSPNTLFSVCIDHLSEAQLATFGWQRIHEDDDFITYQSYHYAERQIVTKAKPRYMLLDDVNDARQMSVGGDPVVII